MNPNPSPTPNHTPTPWKADTTAPAQPLTPKTNSKQFRAGETGSKTVCVLALEYALLERKNTKLVATLERFVRYADGHSLNEVETEIATQARAALADLKGEA